MKKLIFTILTLLTLTFAVAQDGINYQGAATDVNGDELTNQNITIRASVLSTTANGNLEWEETHSATTDQFGLFNVVIGQGTNTTNGAIASFDDMDWGSGNHFLKIEMDATGGTNYAMIGTTQMMSVPYALYAENINMDSVSDYLTNDSSFMANVGGGENQVESSDFKNQTSNSDFNNNITTQIPQTLDGKKVIIYSTDKTIYLTDSVGSFLSVLYSVESNTIGNLTSNSSGDTLYFLQSANSGNATPNIMMTSINNINPVVVGSLPCTQQQLKQFKYFNGNFYYLKTTDLLEISNGSPSVLNSTDNNYCLTVNSSGTIYRSYYPDYASSLSLINGTSYSGPHYEFLFDIDVSESENRIYFWRYESGGDIGYWDLNSNSATILFTADGSYEFSTTYGGQVVRYHDGFVYFNQAKSLFSVQNDGSNSRIISSSNDEYNITGIVPLVFNYQNVNTSGNPTAINVADYIASNNTKIFYSTDKNIYLTDSVGSFLSVLYSVESNTIGNLTSNSSGDTLYFLQSANSGNATPNIMMTSINNINPVVVGSLPCTQQQLKQFKYFNGNFYYLKTTDLLEISNGSPSVLNSTDNNYCLTVNSSGTIYRSYYPDYASSLSLINGTSYSGPHYEFLFDIDVSESENRIYFWRYESGGDIGYWDLNSNSATILFTADGSYEFSTTYGGQVVRYHDGFVYFNQAKSLFSVQNDGSNSRIISSSNDEYNITGIVIVD